MYPHLTGFWHSLPLRHRLTPSCHCECSEAIRGGGAVSPSTSKQESRGRRPLAGVPGGVPLESNRTRWEGGQQPSPALAHQQRIGMFPRACKRESRGRHPSGRRYGGCASINQSSLLPPSFQEGGQGDGPSHHRGLAPNRGSPEDADTAPVDTLSREEASRLSPALLNRSPEGAALWQGFQGVSPCKATELGGRVGSNHHLL